MRVRIVRPTEVANEVAHLTADGVGAVQQLVRSAPRMGTVFDAAENLFRRITAVVDGIDATHRDVRGLLARVDVTSTLAYTIATRIADLADRLTALVDLYEPGLQALAPQLNQVAMTTRAEHTDAALELLTKTPTLVETLERDLIPVLQTLNSVAPDLTELLDVSRTLNDMLATVPGLGKVKKRIDEENRSQLDGAADRSPAEA